jgi:hypothetical protein
MTGLIGSQPFVVEGAAGRRARPTSDKSAFRIDESRFRVVDASEQEAGPSTTSSLAVWRAFKRSFRQVWHALTRSLRRQSPPVVSCSTSCQSMLETAECASTTTRNPCYRVLGQKARRRRNGLS